MSLIFNRTFLFGEQAAAVFVPDGDFHFLANGWSADSPARRRVQQIILIKRQMDVLLRC